MTRLLIATRYLVVVPVVGLALAAGVFFVIGGFRLIRLLIEGLLGLAGLMEIHQTEVPIEVEIVEYIHFFLIGTVLYFTAVGLYQLFIKEIPFPSWLHIDSAEELETNLIGVTIVVLAVNFMGVVFTGNTDNILQIGAGMGIIIAALALFIGLRTWSTHLTKSKSRAAESRKRSEIVNEEQ